LGITLAQPAANEVVQWNETTSAYFGLLAGISTPERAAIYKALQDPAKVADAQKWLREHAPGEYSMLRTSIVPTMLKAGVGPNVIPSEAEATLDIRAFPGEDIDKLYAAMAKVILVVPSRLRPVNATSTSLPRWPPNTKAPWLRPPRRVSEPPYPA